MTDTTGGPAGPNYVCGKVGQNAQRFGESVTKWMEGSLPPEQGDMNHVRYWTLSPEDLTAQIMAVMNMPWGVNISDVTVRATGEDYIN